MASTNGEVGYFTVVPTPAIEAGLGSESSAESEHRNREDCIDGELSGISMSELPNDDNKNNEDDAPCPSQFHSDSTRVALKALIDNTITVVEYGSQVKYRCGYEEVLSIVEWAIPDEQIQRASQVLTEANFPRIVVGSGQERLGYWGTEYLPHDLDGSANGCIHLLPLSLVGLTLEETVEVRSTFAPELLLRTPKPPRYLLSLFRHLLKLSLQDYSRVRVEGDISCFMRWYILRAPPANTPGEVISAMAREESEEDYRKRIGQAVREVRAWDWGDNVEEKYLDIVEHALRDVHYIKTATDVVDDDAALRENILWGCELSASIHDDLNGKSRLSVLQGGSADNSSA